MTKVQKGDNRGQELLVLGSEAWTSCRHLMVLRPALCIQPGKQLIVCSLGPAHVLILPVAGRGGALTMHCRIPANQQVQCAPSWGVRGQARAGATVELRMCLGPVCCLPQTSCSAPGAQLPRAASHWAVLGLGCRLTLRAVTACSSMLQ